MAKCIVDMDYDEWYSAVLICESCECNWMEANRGDSIYCPHCGERLVRVVINDD